MTSPKETPFSFFRRFSELQNCLDLAKHFEALTSKIDIDTAEEPPINFSSEDSATDGVPNLLHLHA